MEHLKRKFADSERERQPRRPRVLSLNEELVRTCYAQRKSPSFKWRDRGQQKYQVNSFSWKTEYWMINILMCIDHDTISGINTLINNQTIATRNS